MKLLDMDSGIKFPSVGDCVTVRHGLYKRDVGYILSIKNWGQVTLLLIPCPPPPPEVGPSSGKGKRKWSGTCPNPTMFTWEVLDNVLLTHSITQYKQEDNGTKMTCVLLGCTFKNSLECRTFNLSAISLTVSMSNNTFFLFQCALHPETRHATFPCPSEWKFSEGECVFVRSLEKQGIIKAIWANSVEVNLEAGEGLMHIPWSALQKCVTLSNFTKVTSRALWGQKGWVTGLTSQLVYITGWSKQEDLMGGVHAGVLDNVLKVNIQLNFGPTTN